VQQGFRFGVDTLRSEGNECNWYAFKRSQLAARPCECNSDKPLQLVVKAALMAYPDALKTPGPHGIPLIAHAQQGGEDAVAVLEYLQSL